MGGAVLLYCLIGIHLSIAAQPEENTPQHSVRSATICIENTGDQVKEGGIRQLIAFIRSEDEALKIDWKNDLRDIEKKLLDGNEQLTLKDAQLQQRLNDSYADLRQQLREGDAHVMDRLKHGETQLKDRLNDSIADLKELLREGDASLKQRILKGEDQIKEELTYAETRLKERLNDSHADLRERLSQGDRRMDLFHEDVVGLKLQLKDLDVKVTGVMEEQEEAGNESGGGNKACEQLLNSLLVKGLGGQIVFHDELQATQTELNDTKEDLKTTQTELNDTKEDLKTTQTELNNMKIQLSTIQSQLNNAQDSLKSQIDSIQEQLKTQIDNNQEQLKTQIDNNQEQLKTQIDNNQDQLTRARREMDNIKEQLESTQAEQSTTRKQMQTQRDDTQKQLQEARKMQAASQQTVESLQTSVQSLTRRVEDDQFSGSTFTRWGSTSCPHNTSRVYHGYAAGAWWDHSGGGANYLCVTSSPRLDIWTHPSKSYNDLAGVEYEDIPGYDDQDMVCSVCRTTKATTIMIPATHTCPAGWTEQYSGHIMAEKHDHKSNKEFVCVDKLKEFRSGGSRNDNGASIYPTVTDCGSLPCPPFLHKYRVTCVVCSM